MLSAATAPELTGRRIGVYEIQAAIGTGGMRVVYRAVDTRLHRPVAIKFLSDTLADPAAVGSAALQLIRPNDEKP
jgi:serine/threonine protein kinase